MDIPVIVIGAGAVGLSCAYALSGRTEVYVLEKEKSIGTGISSRNSEVIHAGLYYNPGSLKAVLCIRGMELLYQFLNQNGLPYRQCGKFIVSVNADEDEKLEALRINALKCGADNISYADKQLLNEKNIKCTSALLSRNTGIFSAHDYMNRLAYHIRENGSEIVLNSTVVNIERINGGFSVSIKDAEGAVTEITSNAVVNAAGLGSFAISEMMNRHYALHLAKGNYFSVFTEKPENLNELVYPVPTKDALGIHLTFDLSGRMKLGPDAYFTDNEDYTVDKSRKDEFYKSASSFLPWIKYDDIEPDMAGMRPKLQGPGEGFTDFVIENLNGFINLVGIESPGLTASLAIGEYVLSLL